MADGHRSWIPAERDNYGKLRTRPLSIAPPSTQDHCPYGGTVLLGGLTSTSQVAASTAEQDTANHGDPAGMASAGANEVEVIARHDHDADRFKFSTTEIPAGWTTFTFDNQTGHTHFVFSGKLPQESIDAANETGVDLLDFYVEYVTRPFQWFMDNLDTE